jgi:peptide/nickel transport system permease protein
MELNNWYLKRSGQALFTVFAVITLSFVLIRALPGGPEAYLRAQLALGGSTSFEEANRLIEQYIKINPSEPLWKQYLDYMLAIFQGDLGTSLYFEEPVAGFLAEVLPWTIFYATISLFITYVLAIVFGAFMAQFEGTRFDSVGSVVSIASNSIPYYAVALILIFILSYQLQIFPTGGKYSPDATVGLNTGFVISSLYHAALPIISIVLTATGGVALAMRGNAISVLGEDYLRVADLRGLPEQRIALRYVARNAVLPLYTQLMISMGWIFGGSVVLETIFRYPAAGYYMLQAIEARDSPLMMGTFIAITIAVVVGVFVADLTYGYLDPRASAGGGAGEGY